MSRQLTATERLERMLAIVPFVAARPGGVPIDELCRRFDLERAELVACLETVFMVGVHPFTPDALIEVDLEPDHVQIRMPEFFRRPLQLTSDQRLALLVARRTFQSMPGADLDGPLLRALDKVAGTIAATDENLTIEFDEADRSAIERLRRAVDEHHAVSFDYYSFGRNSRAIRVVEPWRLQLAGGHWYLEGHCRLAGERRVFRVDRIDDLEITDETIVVPDDLGPLEVFPTAGIDARITLDLRPPARWVLGQYPIDSSTVLDDGRVRATMVVASVPWLERLLLRLGPDAEVVDASADLERVGGDAARRLLARMGE